MPFALPGFFRTLGFDPSSLNPVIWFDMDTSMLAAGDVAATEGDLVAALENRAFLSAVETGSAYGTSISGSVSGTTDIYNQVAPAVSGEYYRIRFTASNVAVRGRVRFRSYSGGSDVSSVDGLPSLSYFYTNGDYEAYIPSDDGVSLWFYPESGWDYSDVSVQQISKFPANATQITSSEQSVAKIPTDGSQPYLLMDIVDDEYEFTTDAAVNGTIVVATLEGTYSANISLSASTQYDLQARGVASTTNRGFLKNVIGYLITPTQLSDAETTNIEAYFVNKGAAARSAFGSVTSFSSTWRDCSSLISFPLLDTSSGADFQEAWRGCTSLASFPLIDTSSGTSFSSSWRECASLASFPLIDTSLGGNFFSAWRDCTSLTTFPLIDTSSGTSFSGTWRDCSSLTSFPLLDTSSGTNFGSTWNGCSSLTSFPANFFDNWSPASVSSGVFNLTWDGCGSLTNTSVENILTSLDTSGIYGTDTGLSSGTQLADHTIDIDYDGTTLSSATTTAIANLKNKDWAININNVIQ